MAKETILAGITPYIKREMHPDFGCQPRNSLAVANCSLQHKTPQILCLLSLRSKAAVLVLWGGAQQEEAFVAVGP